MGRSCWKCGTAAQYAPDDVTLLNGTLTVAVPSPENPVGGARFTCTACRSGPPWEQGLGAAGAG